MELRPGYKQTEVGGIPEDWEVAPLEAFTSFISYGFTNPMPTSESGVHMITAKDINYGKIQFDTARTTTEEAYRTLLTAKSRPKKGDLLLTKDGTLGRLALVDDRTVCINQSVAVLRPNAKAVPEFLKALLEAPANQNRMLEDAGGSTIKHIYITIVNRMLLALPPTKAEQEAIAEALSDTDALIESLEQLIAKKRHLKQGAMQELFCSKAGDEVRLLRDVSTLKGRIGWQGLNQTEFTSNDDQPFLITGMNFKDGAIRWNEVYHISELRYEIAKDIQLKSGDVLMTKDGTIGKVLYIDTIPCPGKASLNSHLLLFRPIRESYNSRYLYYQLSSQRFKDFIEQSKYGTTFFGISQAAVGTYPVLLPPIEDQERIAKTLSDMDAEIDGLETKLAKTRHLKQGMMHNLLTGRIRLVKPAIAMMQHPASNSTERPAAPKPDTPHTWAFNEAVVISVLADQFAKPEFPLGRKRYTKLSYLMHRMAEQAADGYLKKAAGPYNPKTKYAGPERIALENGYIREHQNGKFRGFVAAEKIEQAKAYFSKWYGENIGAWLEQFRRRSNDDLERLATVDMAMQDLLRQGKVVDVASVRALIASEPEWLPKLERTVFSDAGIAAAIAECRTVFGS